MALLAALLVAPTAAHADGTRTKILRDCQDDGILQGDYTAAQMRDARDNQPAELDEYSDCRDVLTRGDRGQDRAQGQRRQRRLHAAGHGRRRPAAPAAAAPAGRAAPAAGRSDRRRRVDARRRGHAPTPAARCRRRRRSGRRSPTPRSRARALQKDVKQISPGAQLTAEVGRNGLPGMLVAVLALIAAAALALVAAPVIRRRGLGSPHVGTTSRRAAGLPVPALDVPLPPAGPVVLVGVALVDRAVRVRRARRLAARAHDVGRGRADARRRGAVRARAGRAARPARAAARCAASGCSARSRCWRSSPRSRSAGR